MSTLHNLSATLPSPRSTPYTIIQSPLPSPPALSLLIRVHAVAINPADAIVQDLGILFPASAYPLVPGSDLAGVVIDPVPADSGFVAGDRVCACVEYGAFQKYAIAKPTVTAKLPDAVAFTDGCVLPLAFCTVLAAVFLPAGMGLRAPWEEKGMAEQRGRGKGEVVVVWGAGSSVGSVAVMMLAAAGYRVIAIAGTGREGYVRGLGAEWALDYKKEGVEGRVKGVLEAQKGEGFAGVFSAVAEMAVIEACARIAVGFGGEGGGKVVGTVLPPMMAFEGETPEGVRIGNCNSGMVIPNSEIAKWMGFAESPEAVELGAKAWKWLSVALDSGDVKCRPHSRVVGHGVGEMQKGLDAWRAGVSAEKVVVEIE